MSGRGSKPEWQKRIAKERIESLFREAERIAKDKPQYARRCVSLAMKTAMRYNMPVPDKYRKRFCRRCHSFFTEGRFSARTRPEQKAVIIRCLACGSVKRYPYRKKIKASN